MDALDVIEILGAVIVCVPLAAALSSWRLTYKFSENGIRLVFRTFFGNLELGHLRFILVEKVKVAPTWKVFPLLFIPLLSFGLRWWQKETVIVEMKAGGYRWVLLTPEDIDSLLDTIRANMPQGSSIEDCRPARNATSA